jgi:exopolyphosphatase/guanosine-5'-triphosphate,3'-diphosphate pyrophosphatase
LGLRDGLLAQMTAEYDRGTRSRKQLESERWDSIRAAIAHYGVEMNHALRVRQAAMDLFLALKPVHRLPSEYQEWLSAAAMLYEVGDYVNRNGRHRHAHYIISHSEILGYSLQQRRIIAAIARYLGKSRPTPNDAPIQELSLDDQECVPKASLLLRLARALDLGRSGSVSTTRIKIVASGVNLSLLPKSRASVDLELWAVEKETSYFREVFGRELSAAAA